MIRPRGSCVRTCARIDASWLPAERPLTTRPRWRITPRPSSKSLGLGPGSSVTSYDAVPGEPPTDEMNARLAAHGIRVLLPVTEADLDLDWHDAADPGARRLGKQAIGSVGLVLAPGLAVDLLGTRMGQGGGCYDKALPRRRPGTPVAVLLHPGEVLADPLPREPHDVPVDLVLTADGVQDLRPSPAG